MREAVGFVLAARKEWLTWAEARRLFIRKAGNAGVLVMVDGAVMKNTRRWLDPAAHRGFALSDRQFPAVAEQRLGLGRHHGLQRQLDPVFERATDQTGEQIVALMGTMDAKRRSAEVTGRVATIRHPNRDRRKLKMR